MVRPTMGPLFRAIRPLRPRILETKCGISNPLTMNSSSKQHGITRFHANSKGADIRWRQYLEL